MRIDFDEIAREVIADLNSIAAAEPNERLPKEEQIRASVYAVLRPIAKVVAVERGYWPIESGAKQESDIWMRGRSGEEAWIEIKRAWAGQSFTNRPRSQVSSWDGDLEKLASASPQSARIFLLVAFFDRMPHWPPAQDEKGLLRCIFDWQPINRVYESPANTCKWRSDGISHVGIFGWSWLPGEKICE